MNGLATTNGTEHEAFIATQVADLTNDTTLLNKFLEEVSNPKIILEQSANDNLTLVQIIVKAGIHLLRERLFLTSEHEVLFASSLRAISNIVNETPEILALPIQSGAIDGQDDLWSWLLSQLVYVLHCDVSDATSDSILHTVHTVLSALQGRLHLRSHLLRCLLYLRGKIEDNKTSKSFAIEGNVSSVVATSHNSLLRSRVCLFLTLYLQQQDCLESLSLPYEYVDWIHTQVKQFLLIDVAHHTSPSSQVLYMTTILNNVTALSGMLRQDRWLNLVGDCLHKVNKVFSPEGSTPDMHDSLKRLIDAILQTDFASPRFWSVFGGTLRVELLQKIVSALELVKITFQLESYYEPQELMSRMDDIPTTDVARASAEISSFFKKRKVETTDMHPLLGTIVAHTKSKDSLKDISAVLHGALSEFDNTESQIQLTLIRSLGQAACAANGNLSEISANGTETRFLCSLCDSPGESFRLPKLDLQKVDLLQICMEFQKIDVFRSNASLRVELMTSIKKIVHHAENAEQLDLSQSSPIKYLNASLADDSRHMRMVTGYVRRSISRAQLIVITVRY